MAVNISEIKNNCCGCHSCEQVCPVNAITFEETEEGFFYPVVDNQKCVSCGLCLKKCAVNEPQYEKYSQKGYAAYFNNTELLRKSSSGGMFSALATEVLENGGCVCGCAEEIPGKVSHRIINTLEDLRLLQGSKYVESDMSGVYSAVNEQLKSGNTILFSGTPCQVAGVKKFTGNPENLITVDIICHGVPSRKLYNSYLGWFGENKGGKVKEYSFRSKEKHDWSLTYRAVVEKKNSEKVYEAIGSLDPYYHHFLRAYNYRESCYVCKYAKPERCGDITLGDFWGIENVAPDFYNSDGVSAVLVNSLKGEKLWDDSGDKIISKEVDVKDIVKHNGQLNNPSQRCSERDCIYEEFNEQGFSFIAKKYKDNRELLFDGIRNIFPNKTRQKIKNMLK